MIERISFSVAGETVVGCLHLPHSGGRFPSVIVGGPMTSVKEQVTGTYAAALAARGIAALALDHRHYGESGGHPRQYERWDRKVEDLLAGAEALSAHPAVDPARLGAVGVCLGAGYVAHAVARSNRFRAFGAVAGYYRDPAEMQQKDPEGFDGKVEQGRVARVRFETTGEADLIPAASLDADAAMSTADTVDYYTRRAAVENYTNAFAVMSREHFLPFDVQAAADGIRVPTLMIHSEKALSPHWARRFHDRLSAPKALLWRVSLGQTDFYDDPKLVAACASDLEGHLLRTLT